METSLNGKSALVCGSSQGIGLASAVELASLGARVTLCARNEADLTTAVTHLPGTGHDILVADFDDPEQLKQKVKETLSAGNTFEILINNSGGPPGGPPPG